LEGKRGGKKPNCFVLLKSLPEKKKAGGFLSRPRKPKRGWFFCNYASKRGGFPYKERKDWNIAESFGKADWGAHLKHFTEKGRPEDCWKKKGSKLIKPEDK